MNQHALPIIAGLVRRTWLVALATVIVCAAFAARAVAALVEASYLAPAPHGVPPHAPMERVPAPARTSPDGTNFVARNMFCSTCVVLTGGPGPTEFFAPDAMLIATSVGAEPSATLVVPSRSVAGSWGLGEKIPYVGAIDQIDRGSIDVVDEAGRHARLSLLDKAAGRGDAGAATPDPAAAAAEPWADRIKKIDDHTFEVDRGLVRDLVGGPTKVGSARITPVTDKDGSLKGLRLSGVATGSLAAALGIKNGDVLTTLNNTHIQSGQTVIDLYAQLDQLNVVEIQGTRGANPLAITLRLR